MDTLPVQTTAVAAAAATASVAAGAESISNGATAAASNPFSALLALQLVGALPAETKTTSPFTDATDAASASDPVATTAADALAGLTLPGWLPPPAVAAPAIRSTHESPAESGDILSKGRATAGTADQRPAMTPKDEPAAAPRGAEPYVHARNETPTRSSESAEHLAAVPRAAEVLTHAADANANIMAAAPVPQPAANAAAAQPALAAPVGTPEWNSELGQKIVWMIGDRQQVAELHVNPPELGPLDIKLTIDSGSTTAVFTSPHSAVRDAVESALPRLREVLADSGIMLGNASVTSDTPRDGRAFAEPRPTARSNDSPAADNAVAPLPARISTGIRGLVDFFA